MVILNRRAFIRVMRYVGSFGRAGPDLSWITNLLGVSGTLHPHHIAELARMEVRAIVDLRAEGRGSPRLLARHRIRFLHLPTLDHSPPSQEQLFEGTRWVLNELQAGRRTLVHCKEGIGRSVVLACCVLMVDGFEPDQAISLVKSKRWGVGLNASQMSAIMEFAQRMPGEGPLLPDRAVGPALQDTLSS